jgi:signal transduction histidine kinase
MRSAVAEERRRIARELHDVIAHNVSVMVVQATAAEDRLEDRPEQAREALQAISSTGRAALSDLRRMLAVVRPDGDESPDAPQLEAGSDPRGGFRVRAVLPLEATP